MPPIAPATVNDLKIEIGKNILQSGLKAIGTQPAQMEVVMRRSQDSYHVEAAEILRDSAPAEIMPGIAQLADRALREVGRDTGDALLSIMSDLTSDFSNVNRWFIDCSTPYFTNLFRQLAKMDKEEMRNTLEALAAYARGE